MAGVTVEQALENIYASLHNNNENIDFHIGELKSALPDGKKSVTVDSGRIYQSNREGRKTMQAYFRKRGVTIAFSGVEQPKTSS